MPLRQRGLTMVELLVALALSTVIALAAVAALVASRRGFTSVDAASELRDNGRFAASMIQRITAQSGYLDTRFAMVNRIDTQDLLDPPPNIFGYNNALVGDVADPLDATDTADGNRSGDCNANTAAAGGCSDILVVRYQSQIIPGAAPAGSPPISDNTMIDCSGRPITEVATTRDDQGVSMFYVGRTSVTGEPTLMCLTGRQFVNAAGVVTTTWQAPVPVITGVESFQVLYGTDGVTPGAAPPASSADSVPDRLLRADQLAGGTTVATNQNWRRVRSVRIGMILRGPVGSEQLYDPNLVLYPFGLGRDIGGTAGYALSTADSGTGVDRGTRFQPLNDGRLRQTQTFTVYLHNDQGLCVGRACAVQ